MNVVFFKPQLELVRSYTNLPTSDTVRETLAYSIPDIPFAFGHTIKLYLRLHNKKKQDREHRGRIRLVTQYRHIRNAALITLHRNIQTPSLSILAFNNLFRIRSLITPSYVAHNKTGSN